jgi:hypothetical protein
MEEVYGSINFEIRRDDTDDFEVFIANSQIEDAEGRSLVQKDYRIQGSVFQVHKGDADPFPSKPHAHCVAGMYKGKKVHLGSGALYSGPTATGDKLSKKTFMRLCDCVKPKFPGITFPLKS